MSQPLHQSPYVSCIKTLKNRMNIGHHLRYPLKLNSSVLRSLLELSLTTDLTQLPTHWKSKSSRISKYACYSTHFAPILWSRSIMTFSLIGMRLVGSWLIAATILLSLCDWTLFKRRLACYFFCRLARSGSLSSSRIFLLKAAWWSSELFFSFYSLRNYTINTNTV